MATTMETTKARERVGYLFGHPIAHSMSPLLHQTIYDNLGLNWTQVPFDSTDMDTFLGMMKDPRFYGASVTMPHKLAILAHLDDLTEEGREVGACNTIFVRTAADGTRRYIGTNTDVVGIRLAFYQNISRPEAVFHGRPGLVIGGGGAARSAIYALRKWMRASPIYLVNRDPSEVEAMMADCRARGYGDGLVHVASVDEARRLDGPGAVVACVPDLAPRTAGEKTARAVAECFLQKPHKGAMLEMCYHPSPWTALGALAENEGWQVILGTEAMIWQGIEQDKFWTGREIEDLPVKQVQEAIQKQLNQPRL